MKRLVVVSVICLLVAGVFVVIMFKPFLSKTIVKTYASQAEIDNQRIIDAFLSKNKTNIAVPSELNSVKCSRLYQTDGDGKPDDTGEYAKYQAALIKKEGFINGDWERMSSEIDICPSKYGNFVFLSYIKYVGGKKIMDVFKGGGILKKVLVLNADVPTPTLFTDAEGKIFYQHEYVIYNRNDLKNDRYQTLFFYNPVKETFELVYNKKIESPPSQSGL